MGDLLTRLTVWLAVSAYAAGTLLILRGRGLIVWSVGCSFFLLHVACAFGFFHHWSHSEAYLETGRQTAELTGVRSGAGLFLNYLFAVAWLGDVIWWWCAPASHARRARWITSALHGFMFFMVFNGAFVFAHGAQRWLGLVLCIVVATAWLRRNSVVRSGGERG